MTHANNPKFKASFDPQARRVVAKATGFWSLADAEAFFAALKTNVEEATLRCSDFTMLGDFTAAAIQDGTVVNINTSSAAMILRSSARRIAIVTTSKLKQMQLKRFLSDPRVGFFEDPSAALAWLDG
jgi:hypothetical protein